MRIEYQTASCPPTQYPGVDVVFPGLHAFRQRFFVIVRQYRHPGVGDSGATIQLLGDEVHGTAVFVVACFQRPAMGVKPLVAWQQ